MKRLSPTAVRLVEVLEECPPTVDNGTLATLTARRTRSVQRALNELRAAGLVQIDHYRPQAACDTARMIRLTRKDA